MNSHTQTNLSTERAKLRGALHDQRQAIDRMLLMLDEPDASLIVLMDHLEALEHLNDHRFHLTKSFRVHASEMRRLNAERSVRQYVVQALDVLSVPLPSGNIQDFVWVNDRVELNTRSFGALRRDEARAWGRSTGQRRVAYVVPALDSGGHAQSKWMARSDWPLWRRIVVDDADRLFDLKWLIQLFEARTRSMEVGRASPYEYLIKKYSGEILNMFSSSESGGPAEPAWLASVRQAAVAEIDSLELVVKGRQLQAQESLSNLPEANKMWGVGYV
jgi:hypothetical protein